MSKQFHTEFLYYFDPLCGWCYACAPTIQTLAKTFGEQLQIMPTGLFNEPRPISSLVQVAKTHDPRITQLTGQPFSEKYNRTILEAPEGVFSSKFLNLAIVALGEIDPALEHRFLHAAQQARYVDAQDTVRSEVAANLAAHMAQQSGHTLNGEQLHERLLLDNNLHQKTLARFQTSQSDMRSLGLQGVPQLVVQRNGQRHPVANGLLYQGAQAVLDQLNQA